LARLVRAAQSEHRLPSVSAAVVVRGERVLELALGVADAQSGREATADTQYRIGSITKTFTAAAVVALVDEGRIALDDPLGAHVARGAWVLRRSVLRRAPSGGRAASDRRNLGGGRSVVDGPRHLPLGCLAPRPRADARRPGHGRRGVLAARPRARTDAPPAR